jgi:hypothetical protein
MSSPLATTFVMRQATGGRWLNVAVMPLADADCRRRGGLRL